MTDYLLLALFVLAEGFFSGSETGFYCVNRVRLRLRVQKKWPGALALQRLNADPQAAVSAMLIGTNISVYMASILLSRRLRGIESMAGHADLYASLILPPVLLVFAEIVPKSVFQRHADTMMYRTAGPLALARALFRPVLFSLAGVSWVIRRMAQRWRTLDPRRLTADRFQFFLSEGVALGVVSRYQQVVANNILRVKSLGTDTAMVPLDDAVMIPETTTRDELREVLAGHHFSRIPVYAGERTNVVGLVNVIDLLAARGRSGPLSDIMRSLPTLDAEMSVAESLYALQRARRPMAVVVHKEQVVGIVTVRDLVQEIVGELTG